MQPPQKKLKKLLKRFNENKVLCEDIRRGLFFEKRRGYVRVERIKRLFKRVHGGRYNIKFTA